MKCPKCDGEMEKGYMPEYAHYYVDVGTRWSKEFDNPPIRKVSDAEEVIAEEEKASNVRVIVYRCKECGYLESYAK